METSGADDGTAAAAAAAPLSSLLGQEEGNKDPTNEEAREFMMSGAGAGTAMKNSPAKNRSRSTCGKFPYSSLLECTLLSGSFNREGKKEGEKRRGV